MKKTVLIEIGASKLNNAFNFDDAKEFAGRAGSLCYDQEEKKYLLEERETSIKRGNMLIKSKHTSTYEHYNVSFCIHGLSKFMSLLLNNQSLYALSERSFRYTKIQDNNKYTKWLNYFTDLELPIGRAKELARYQVSLFDKNISAIYTFNIRQLNHLFYMLKNFKITLDKLIKRNTGTSFFKYAKKDVESLIQLLDKYDMGITPHPNQHIRFFVKDISNYPERFEKKYQISYITTPVTLAQIQRHRKIEYYINLDCFYDDIFRYYLPDEILKTETKEEWIKDLYTTSFPQGMLIKILEFGDISAFLDRHHERTGKTVQPETKILIMSLYSQFYNRLRVLDFFSPNDSGII